MGIYLYHGDSDYRVSKLYQKLIETLEKEKKVPLILDLNKKISFSERIVNFSNSGLFEVEKKIIIIKGVTEMGRVHKFFDEMFNYFEYKKNLEILGQLDIHIFNKSKVPKNTILYKKVSKVGKIYEVSEYNLKDKRKFIESKLGSFFATNSERVIDSIIQRTGENMFYIENSCNLIESYCRYTNKNVSLEIVGELVFENIENSSSWEISKLFMQIILSANNDMATSLKKFTDEIEKSRQNSINFNLILYGFYFYVTSAIKLKKRQLAYYSFKDCISVGYYFVKEYFEGVKKVSLKELKSWNHFLLKLEQLIKSGKISDEIAAEYITNYIITKV